MLRTISKPIPLNGARCVVEGNVLLLSGRCGSLSMSCPEFANCILQETAILIKLSSNLTDLSKSQKALIGSFMANLKLNLNGVERSHERTVIFTGTGSSVKVIQNSLTMRIGKSHLVEKEIPSYIECKIESSDIRETRLKVSGITCSLVGQFASELCVRNAYKGGIHIWVEGKEVPIKEGKKSG